MPSAEERPDLPSGSPIIGVAVLGALTLVGAAVVHYEFSFAPRVSPSAEPPAVIAAKPPVKIPGRISARLLDVNGVVRVLSPADSAMASAYTLAALLKRTPVDLLAFEKALDSSAPSPNFVAAGKILGFDARSVEVREDAIQKDPRPMILPLTGELDVIETAQSLEKRLGEKAVTPGLRAGSRIRYVVLGEVHGSEAVLLDPLAGRMLIPLHDLVKRVEGKGVVWIPLQKK